MFFNAEKAERRRRREFLGVVRAGWRALRANWETGWARSRLRRRGAMPVVGPVNKFPVRRRGTAPAPFGAFPASPDWEARRSGGTENSRKSQGGLMPRREDLFQAFFRGPF